MAASGDGTLTVSYEANGKDCNGNGIEDSIDIAEGKSSDCNSNGVPDECDLANGLSGDCDGGPSGVKSAGQYLIDTWCFGCHGDDGGGGKGYPGPSLRDKRRTELWTMLRTPTDHPGGSQTNSPSRILPTLKPSWPTGVPMVDRTRFSTSASRSRTATAMETVTAVKSKPARRPT